MNNKSTLYVGLDVHKESITVAYAINSDPVELLGKIGTTPLILKAFARSCSQNHLTSALFMSLVPVVMAFTAA